MAQAVLDGDAGAREDHRGFDALAVHELDARGRVGGVGVVDLVVVVVGQLAPHLPAQASGPDPGAVDRRRRRTRTACRRRSRRGCRRRRRARGTCARGTRARCSARRDRAARSSGCRRRPPGSRSGRLSGRAEVAICPWCRNTGPTVKGSGCVVAGEWEDKLAIRETLERYMRYNDDGALDRLVALFAEDAVLQVMGRVLRGHEQIRAFLGAGGVFVDGRPQWTDPGQLLLQPRSAHLSANPVIDVDGRHRNGGDRLRGVAARRGRSCARGPRRPVPRPAAEERRRAVGVRATDGRLARRVRARRAPTASGNVRWRVPARPWSDGVGTWTES